MRDRPCGAAPDGVHLFHPEQVRTGERVAALDPPRPYWAGCAVCGATVDLAGPARRRPPRFTGGRRDGRPRR